jgi:hypothetical protein
MFSAEDRRPAKKARTEGLGAEFQRLQVAAAGNDRRLTAVSRYGPVLTADQMKRIRS